MLSKGLDSIAHETSHGSIGWFVSIYAISSPTVSTTHIPEGANFEFKEGVIVPRRGKQAGSLFQQLCTMYFVYCFLNVPS